MADEPAAADPPPVGSLVRVRPSTARLSSSATSPMSVSTSDPLPSDSSRPRLRRAQGTLEKTLEYQSFTAETEDHEDHTFCGIFFDLHASDRFPVSYLEISRCGLAPLAR